MMLTDDERERLIWLLNNGIYGSGNGREELERWKNDRLLSVAALTRPDPTNVTMCAGYVVVRMRGLGPVDVLQFDDKGMASVFTVEGAAERHRDWALTPEGRDHFGLKQDTVEVMELHSIIEDFG